jgi:hypothetical protein
MPHLSDTRLSTARPSTPWHKPYRACTVCAPIAHPLSRLAIPAHKAPWLDTYGHEISGFVTALTDKSSADVFNAKPSDMLVNIFWFMSLLLSLVVALFGIFLKQWIRTHLKWTDVTPEWEAVSLRHYRYLNLEEWNVDTILTVLPIMLQAAVILFLVGLVILL